MTAMADRPHRPFLDTAAARLLALAVALVGVALFVAGNWDTLSGARGGAAGDAAFDACMAERLAAVEALEREAGASPKRRELMRARAVEICRNQAAQ